VHASRTLRFDGALTTRRQIAANRGWSDSVLQGVYDKLRAFNGSFAAVNAMLQDASQGVFKMKDLISMMGADGRTPCAAGWS
jgi:hypothetical protein